MLTQLLINNLAIIEQTNVELATGMNVVTGETGAGKSILIHALALALGERSSPGMVREPYQQGTITACFETTNLLAVKSWLENYSLQEDDTCIIRRVISSNGKSKAYINHQPVTINQLKQLGELLVSIHSQHEFHNLLDNDYQLQLLDEFAGCKDLISELNTHYLSWKNTKQEITNIQLNKDHHDKLELLEFQITELDELNFSKSELIALEQEHKKLTKSDDLINSFDKSLAILINSDINIENLLNQLNKELQYLCKYNEKLNTSCDSLAQVSILLKELTNDLQQEQKNLNCDPQRLAEVEHRLSLFDKFARKYKVATDYLSEQHQQLCRQKEEILQANNNLILLEQKLAQIESDYNLIAAKLSKTRKKVAKELSKLIRDKLVELELINAQFVISITEDPNADPKKNGNDKIEFQVTTNPGQPLKPLKKIGSGGELSRVSLAIQVITAKKLQLPTLVFDEVDVGISGKTASLVGKLMQNLAKHTQIICITHSPQIASQAKHHFKVVKSQKPDTTSITLTKLSDLDRTQEIARLLGGIKVDENAIANAKSLLAISD